MSHVAAAFAGAAAFAVAAETGFVSVVAAAFGVAAVLTVEKVQAA